MTTSRRDKKDKKRLDKNRFIFNHEKVRISRQSAKETIFLCILADSRIWFAEYNWLCVSVSPTPSKIEKENKCRSLIPENCHEREKNGDT